MIPDPVFDQKDVEPEIA